MISRSLKALFLRSFLFNFNFLITSTKTISFNFLQTSVSKSYHFCFSFHFLRLLIRVLWMLHYVAQYILGNFCLKHVEISCYAFVGWFEIHQIFLTPWHRFDTIIWNLFLYKCFASLRLLMPLSWMLHYVAQYILCRDNRNVNLGSLFRAIKRREAKEYLPRLKGGGHSRLARDSRGHQVWKMAWPYKDNMAPWGRKWASVLLRPFLFRNAEWYYIWRI